MLKHPYYVQGSMDLEVPARLHFGEYLLQQMNRFKEKNAFINGATNEITTYGQIVQEAMNLAVSLSHLGLRKGQIVSICAENRVEYWSVAVGVACAGAILNTINPAYSEYELKHAMNISKPSIVILSPLSYKTNGKFFKSLPYVKKIILLGDEKQQNVILFNDIARVSNVINNNVTNNATNNVIVNNRLARNVMFEEFQVVDVQGQVDTLMLLYSSGTTGMPKGVLLTHLNVIGQCCLLPAMDVNLISLIVTPWFHVMGLVGTLTGLAKGRTCVFLAKFETDLFLKTIENYKIKEITIVPPIVVAIGKAQGKYDLSSVDAVFSGAAPLSQETADLLKSKFPKLRGVYQGYGMTEAGLTVSRFIKKDQAFGLKKPGSVGKLTDGLTVKVVDVDTRKPLGPNQPGELCVKGIHIMKGYTGLDRKETFDDEGFFKTGDVGYYDEDKCFYIVDRLKELIKYKGFQVAPAELEALLLKHEAIRDAGVIGIPNRSAGEVPLAFVVKQTGADVTEREIQDFVKEKLSNPKHLRGGVRFVEAIPKNPSGKILRKTLRQMAKTNTSKL